MRRILLAVALAVAPVWAVAQDFGEEIALPPAETVTLPGRDIGVRFGVEPFGDGYIAMTGGDLGRALTLFGADGSILGDVPLLAGMRSFHVSTGMATAVHGSEDGTYVWVMAPDLDDARRFELPGAYTHGQVAAALPDGSVIVAGSDNDNIVSSAILALLDPDAEWTDTAWILRLRPNGRIAWAHVFADERMPDFTAMQVAGEVVYLAATGTEETSLDPGPARVFAFDLDGDLRDVAEIGPADVVIRSMALVDNDMIVVSGWRFEIANNRGGNPGGGAFVAGIQTDAGGSLRLAWAVDVEESGRSERVFSEIAPGGRVVTLIESEAEEIRLVTDTGDEIAERQLWLIVQDTSTGQELDRVTLGVRGFSQIAAGLHIDGAGAVTVFSEPEDGGPLQAQAVPALAP